MIWVRTLLVTALVSLGTTAHAATILFSTDPFESTTALETPGRQIVGGSGTEISFDPAQDVLAFDPDVFGITEILFANTVTSALPTSGVNVIVVQDTGSPFLAGIAANAIAAQVTAPGPGFFIYFNTNLDVARLVYSTDLSDPTADLAVLARLTTFSGAAGFANLPTITAGNFALQSAPEPTTMLLFGLGFAGLALQRRRRD